jgi:hypothetical protein
MPERTSTARRLRPSPSIIISIFALVIAMSSGAYAAVTIAEKNSVVSKSIKDKNVKSADIKPSAVKKKHLASNSVDSSKIIDGQVGSSEIADGSVGSSKIADGSVGSADIGDGQIGASDFSPTALGNYYTKAETDGKFKPLLGLIRGTTIQAIEATAAGQSAADNITYGGATLSAPPTTHYIALGALVPAGCSGTADAPVAAAGHLCVFEVFSSNNTGNGLFGPGGGGTSPSAFGGVLFASSAAAGQMVITTNWAVRPVALAPAAAPGNSVKSNTGGAGGPFLP